MEKFGLVLEGGGVRGAYTAGCLAWLLDHDIKFDYNTGISSGAVYLCCYLVGNKQAMYNMSVHYSVEKETVGIRAIFKEGYYVAYKRIFKHDLLEREHLSLDKIKEDKIDVEVGAYVLEDGKTEFFGRDKLDSELDLLRGTCALPIASAIVEYDGKHLLDGGITKMIPIERAMENGCDKYLVITTKPKDYVRKPGSPIVKFLMKHIYKQYPEVVKDYNVRHLNYYHQVDLINKLVEKKKAVHILPSQTIKVSRFKGDVKSTQALYDLGYADMESRKDEIFAFLGK